MKSNRTGRKRATAGGTVTMEAVARMAGVSMMTVSRALSGNVNVKAETRQRIESAIEELGYSPNISARSLASSKSPFIGLPYFNPSSGYLGQMLSGALIGAHEVGLHLVLEASGADPHLWGVELSNFCSQSKLRGLLLPPPFCDSQDVLQTALETGLPTVRISPSDHVPPFGSVRIDEFMAARTMTQLLIEQGHRKIGFLHGDMSQKAARLRFDGYCSAMDEAGIRVNSKWQAVGHYALEPAMLASREILERPERPTAIFASNDEMAAGVYATAHQLGLRIPDDLAIVGFDNEPIAASLWPGLTTVNQPIAEMAKFAVRLLALRGEEAGRDDRPLADNVFPFDVALRKSHGFVSQR